MYDITDRTSYENVKNWLEEIDKFVDEKTKKYIIGNKCDLEERRQVSTEEALQLSISKLIQQVRWEFPLKKLQLDSPQILKPSSRS